MCNKKTNFYICKLLYFKKSASYHIYLLPKYTKSILKMLKSYAKLIFKTSDFMQKMNFEMNIMEVDLCTSNLI